MLTLQVRGQRAKILFELKLLFELLHFDSNGSPTQWYTFIFVSHFHRYHLEINGTGGNVWGVCAVKLTLLKCHMESDNNFYMTG